MKSSEKLRDQGNLWLARADSAIEEARKAGEARAVRFREKAERLFMEAMKVAAQERDLIVAQTARQLEETQWEVEGAALRALNSFNAVLLRKCMHDVRNLQSNLVISDVNKARSLDALHTKLRARAELLERAAVEKRIRREARLTDPNISVEDLAERVEARWQEYLRQVSYSK